MDRDRTTATTAADGSSLGRRIDALDGLRGLAIIGVITEHTLPWSRLGEIAWLKPVATLMSMGWVGVELFFVISGYLITRVLLRAQSQKRYYRNFWGRRITRIVPGYALLVAAVYLLTPPLANSPSLVMGGPEESVVWYALFAVNLFPLLGFLPHQFLLLTWSVAVEQQFYLLWPAVCRWLTPARLARFAGLLFLLMTASRILLLRGAGAEPGLLYYLGITHFDGLAAGAFVAALGAERLRGARLACAVAAFAGLILAGGATLWAAFDPVPGREIALHPVMAMAGYGGFALLFASLLAAAVAPGRDRLARVWRAFLEAAWLRFVGRISYSLYLAHLPMVWLVGAALGGLGVVASEPGGLLLLTLLGTALTVAAATLSFAWLERPFIRVGQRLFA